MKNLLIFIFFNMFISSVNSFTGDLRDKVALLDTGILKNQRESKFACKEEPLNFSSSDTYEDKVNHGSKIFDILSSYIDPNKTCILSVKIFSEDGIQSNTESSMFKAFQSVDSERFKFFNMSFSGLFNSSQDLQLITNLTNRGQVVVASGNDGLKLTKESCYIYPACYNIKNNFHVASSIDCPVSNRGIYVVDFYLKRKYTYMGSSMAVPHALGELIKKYYK